MHLDPGTLLISIGFLHMAHLAHFGQTVQFVEMQDNIKDTPLPLCLKSDSRPVHCLPNDGGTHGVTPLAPASSLQVLRGTASVPRKMLEEWDCEF